MSRSTTDHALLYGILAMQMAFVDRDQLIAAMNAWVLDKQRSLGEILRQQGALTDEVGELLDALVAKHLQQHNNDIQRCVADLSSISHIVAELQQVADTDLQQSLQHATLAPSTLPAQGQSSSWASEEDPATRFRILRFHAKGGLGQVSVAVDQQLNREVALKELQARHADNPESRARFVAEAEITGGLEHPSIVPVYGLGYYADGRPFYAMRFVRGDSLAEAIDRFHAKPAADASEQTLQLRKLLGRLIDVCEAVQYAHSRGVLHRDLKPGNIMLGKYGETLVVDWGLAKSTGRRDDLSAEGESLLKPSLSGDVPKTMMGSAIGTPSYMSPEQAAGRYDQLGPASDVYSLGATLYCLLTGQSPIRGNDISEILEKTQHGIFPRPRKVNRQIAPTLEAICLRAMATAAEARYATPKALAEEIERWLADEPVEAFPESMVRRTQRWLRRHRGVAAAVAATLLLVAAVSSIAAVLVGQARDEALQSAEDRREALVVAQQQRTQAEQQRDRAERETQRATAAEVETRQALTQVEQARSRAERIAYNSTLSEASRLVGSEPMLARSLLESDARCPPRLRDFAWHCLFHQVTREQRTIPIDDPWALTIVYSPDGEIIATTGSVEGVVLWDSATGEKLRILECPQANLEQIAFSSDGSTLAAASTTRSDQEDAGPDYQPTTQLYVWNLDTGKRILQHTIEFEGMGQLLFSSDGFHYHWLYTEQEYALSHDEYRPEKEMDPQGSHWCRWGDFHLQTGKQTVKLLQCGESTVLQSVEFYSGHLLVGYGEMSTDRFVWMFDTRTQTPTLLENWRATQDEDRILLLADDNQVQLLNMKLVEGSMSEIDSLAELDSLMFDLDLELERWDLPHHRRAEVVPLGRIPSGMFIDEFRIDITAANPSGRYLALLFDRRPVIQLFDLEQPDWFLSVPAHVGDVVNVAISPDGRQVASVGVDRVMRLWDVRQLCGGASTAPLSIERPSRILITPDDQQVLILGQGPEPEESALMPVDEPETVQPPEEPADNQPPPFIQAEFRRLSDAEPERTRDFAEPPSPRPNTQGLAGVLGAFASALGSGFSSAFGGHPLDSSMSQLRLTSDGSQLIFATSERLLRFDLKTGQGEEIWGERHLDPNRLIELDNVVVSDDLTQFATLNHEDDAIRLYDMQSQNLLWELPCPEQNVDTILLSPDNKTLMVEREVATEQSMLGPYQVEFWDLTTKSRRAINLPEFQYVEDYTFSPDGRLLVTHLLLERRVAVWDIETGQLVSQLNVLFDTPAGMLPGSDLLVLLGELGEMKLWDVRLSQYRASLQVLEDEKIIDYKLSADRKTLVVLGENGSLRFLGADRHRDDLADVYKLMHTERKIVEQAPLGQTPNEQPSNEDRPVDIAASDLPLRPQIEVIDYVPPTQDETNNQEDEVEVAPLPPAPLPPAPLIDPNA